MLEDKYPTTKEININITLVKYINKINRIKLKLIENNKLNENN